MNFLQQYVQRILGWKPKDVKNAYLELQQGYRASNRIGYANLEQIQAYVFTRFPATYQVCLKLIDQHLINLKIDSVLDWGCGIGTASLALSERFENIKYYLVEQDSSAKEFAMQFLEHFHPKNIIDKSETYESVDLTVFSYSLNEVNDWKKIIDVAWDKTKYLLIIEPGTTLHFKRLLIIRDYLLGKGAHLWGPCCHTKACPLQANDWCHFSVNVPRSKEHRMLKGAERGFENEAYSYLLFSKEPKAADFGRIVAAPRIHGGHINLKICSNDGEIIAPTIGRSSVSYKSIKKSEWGDSITRELL